MNVQNPATTERLLSVDDALAAILARIPVLLPETVLLDEALGRVLAEDVYADMPCRRSTTPLWTATR